MCTNIIYPPPSFFLLSSSLYTRFAIFFIDMINSWRNGTQSCTLYIRKYFVFCLFIYTPPPFRLLRNHTHYARRSYTLYRHDQLKTLIPKQCPYTCETAINCGCGLGFFPPLNRAVKFYSFKRRDVIAIG